MKSTKYMHIMSHRNQKPRVCMSTKCLITYRLFLYYNEAELIQKLTRKTEEIHMLKPLFSLSCILTCYVIILALIYKMYPKEVEIKEKIEKKLPLSHLLTFT